MLSFSLIRMEGKQKLQKDSSMKIKSSLKAEKNGDQLVRRKGRLYRINKKDPRRKARQG